MRFEPFALLLTTLPIALSVQKPIDYAGIRDNLQTASFYAEEVTKGIVSEDLSSTFQNALGLAGTINPILGSFAGGVQLILSFFKGARTPTENPLQVALRNSFNEVGRILDRNLAAIKNLKFELQIEIRGLSLLAQTDDIGTLVSLYEQFIEQPDNLTIFDFTNACYLSRVHEKPLWLTNSLTAENPSNLKHLILGRGEKQKLNSFYQQILSLLLQALLMDSACTAVFFRNENNVTLQSFMNRRGAQGEQYVRQIAYALSKDMNLLDNHFFQFAENDVFRCAEANRNSKNEDAVQCLADTFGPKYERRFFAIAYAHKSSEDNYNSLEQYNKLIKRQEGKSCTSYAKNYVNIYSRNYVVCFPSDCISQERKDASKSCLSAMDDSSGSCKDRVKKLSECMSDKNQDFMLAGCFTGELRYALNTTISVGFQRFAPYSFYFCN